MAKFAIIWMWEANFCDKPIVVEADSAAAALKSYKLNSIYSEKFWETAQVFAFPADDIVKWDRHHGACPWFGRYGGGTPELKKKPAELTELPEFDGQLSVVRAAHQNFLALDKEQKGVLQEAAPQIHAALALKRNEALDNFRWRAMEYVDLLLKKFYAMGD